MRKEKFKNGAFSSASKKPLLIILSGPSGAGKDAIISGLKKTGYPLKYVTTVTTRPQRLMERDNIDYHFVSVEKFLEMARGGDLLEWAIVYDNWYGVPKQPVKAALDRGQDVMVKVDVQGAANIKKIVPQAVFIFLATASREELVDRLEERQTESSYTLRLRLKTAEAEMERLPLFDYVVVNKRGQIDTAVTQIQAIISAEKCHVVPREISL